MMKIEDYRRVDCKLYRTPPLDFSEVTRAARDALLEAWKHEISAGRAIEELLEGDLAKGLAEQIRENIEFQARNEQAQLDTYYGKQIEALQNGKEKKIGSIDEKYKSLLEEREKKISSAKEAVEKVERGYDASTRKLGELQEELARKIKDMGGIEKYNQLQEIKDMLLDDQKKPPKKKVKETIDTLIVADKKVRKKAARSVWRRIWDHIREYW